MKITDELKTYSIKSLIGQGYVLFWNCKCRYRVVKGSRASKKSRTTAYWYIINMMNPKYSLANLLVIRKTERTLKDSCYSELLWVIYKLNVQAYWKCTTNPLQMIYLPTGQKILFRGLDEPMKLTSISVPVGYLCWVWIEEAFEIVSETDFDMINHSIRGLLPESLFHQITLTFNPYLSSHWLKKRFFDHPDSETLALTTTYKINEWLDEPYKKELEKLKEINPRLYKVSALGEWGAIGNQIYERYDVILFNPKEIKGKWIFGLDFGYSNDPSAFFVGIIDEANHELYVVDEFYQKELWNNQLAEKIIQLGYHRERIYADCANPKDISELKTRYQLSRIIASRKGKNSIMNGIGFIQNYHIVIHPKCKNFIFEIENYVYKKDKFDKPINEPEDTNNHLMDAMRYALEPYIVGSSIRFI